MPLQAATKTRQKGTKPVEGGLPVKPNVCIDKFRDNRRVVVVAYRFKCGGGGGGIYSELKIDSSMSNWVRVILEGIMQSTSMFDLWLLEGFVLWFDCVLL